MEDKNRGRRTGFASWIVEPYKQIKIGLIFLVTNMVFTLAIGSVFGYYIWDIYSTIAGFFENATGQQVFTLEKFMVPIFSGILILSLFVIATILLSIKYTHQIYGPLVSIHRYLDTLLQGKVPKKLQLRNSDQLQELADQLNQLPERLHIDQRMGPIGKINRYLDDLIAGNTDPKPIGVRDTDYAYKETVQKIEALAQRLNKEK